MTRMTRMTRILSALSLSVAFAAVTVVACGGRPGAPGELPPLAPRPDPASPGEPGTNPRPASLEPALVPGDAGAALTPGPVASGTTLRLVRSPVFAPVVSEAAAMDAGTSDAYAPPLPPLPDGGVPADSQLEPR